MKILNLIILILFFNNPVFGQNDVKFYIEAALKNNLKLNAERENHKGFFAYSMKEEALQAVFPRSSRLKDSPRVLLKVFVPHDSVEHVDRDIYVCTRLKPKKVWDICIDNDDDQKQFRGISSTAHADTYDHMGACRGAQKWKIVEWNHGGIWK